MLQEYSLLRQQEVVLHDIIAVVLPQPEVRVPILHRQEVAVAAAVPVPTVVAAEAVAVQAVVAVDVPADADKKCEYIIM